MPTFTQIPVYQLIGAPLEAMVQAEALAAQASAEFIEAVGFSKDSNTPSDGFGHIKTVSFTYKQQNVNGEEETKEIAIPILSLVPIPMLQIKDATLEFNLKISETSAKQKTTGNNIPLADTSLTYKNDTGLALRGVYVPTNVSTQSDIDLKLKINVVQADIPVGLSRLFQIMDIAVSNKDYVAPPLPPSIDPDPVGNDNNPPPTH